MHRQITPLNPSPEPPQTHRAPDLFGPGDEPSPGLMVQRVASNAGRKTSISPGDRTSPGPKRRSKLTAWEKDAERRMGKIEREEAQKEREARGVHWEPHETPRATPAETHFRHWTWQRRRALVLTAMKAAGYSEARIERVRQCGACARVIENADTGEYKTRAFFCHDRWCDPCSAPRILNIADNLRTKLGAATISGIHGVLTLAHRDEPLAQSRRRLMKCFKTLRETPLWRAAVAGGAAFFQGHPSKDGRGWHAHIHFVAESTWLDAVDLSALWWKITGDSMIVHVSRIHDADGVVREVCRYAAQPADKGTIQDPDQLAEMMRALTGARLCYTFGTWWGGQALTARPPAEEVRWIDHGPYTLWVARARAGDEHAKHVLAILWSKSLPKTGPPRLYTIDWRSEESPTAHSVPEITP